MRVTTYLVALACCLALVPETAAGGGLNVDPPGFSNVPFTFEPPGARSLGMGGTFIGLADDATASEANPAGLTILTRPEVSIHVRNATFDVEALDVNANIIDDSFGPAFPDPSFSTISVFDESVTSASFGSFVYPIKQRWVLSAYWQQATNFEGDDTNTLNLLPGDSISSTRRLEATLGNFGVSAGFKVNEWFSVGASLRASRLTLETFDQLDAQLTNGGAGAINFDTIVDDDDTQFTYNVGVMFRPGEMVSVGVVYKQGGDFDIEGVDNCASSAPQSCDIVAGDSTSDPFFVQIEVPDFLGAGVAIRPLDQLTLVADIDFITYSDIAAEVDDFDLAFCDFDFDGIVDEPDCAANPVETVDDEIEVHVGAEYVFFVGENSTPLSLRAGVFSDPDHDNTKEIDSDQVHASLGIGVVIKEDFQLDFAVRAADTITDAVFSFVYRF